MRYLILLLCLVIPIVASDYQDAVALAKKGELRKSLEIFESLYPRYRSSTPFIYDYVAVLSWSGEDAKALNLYERYSTLEWPRYTL